MKKKTHILLLTSLMVLVGCGGNSSSNTSSSSSNPSISNSQSSNSTISSSEVSSEVESSSSSSVSFSNSEVVFENTVYLNLTKYGLFDGTPGQEISSQGLTYGVTYTANTGTLLPGADRVTNTRGYAFLGWVVQAPTGGGLTMLTQMPGASHMILQAWWNEESTSSSSESSSSSETPSSSEVSVDSGVYLAVNGTTFDETYQLTEGYSTVLQATEYSMTGSFTAGFEFKIRSQTDIFGIGDTTYPTTKSGKADGIGYTLAASGTTNYTTNYLEVVNPPSSNGVSSDGAWYNFGQTNPTNLRFKTTGNYAIYITLWDNYGWVRIYVQPA